MSKIACFQSRRPGIARGPAIWLATLALVIASGCPQGESPPETPPPAVEEPRDETSWPNVRVYRTDDVDVWPEIEDPPREMTFEIPAEEQHDIKPD